MSTQGEYRDQTLGLEDPQTPHEHGRIWKIHIQSPLVNDFLPDLLFQRSFLVVLAVFGIYYESIKRELKRRPLQYMNDSVMKDSKLKLRDLHVSYTFGLIEGLEHLKIESSLIDERFASVMGECVTLK